MPLPLFTDTFFMSQGRFLPWSCPAVSSTEKDFGLTLPPVESVLGFEDTRPWNATEALPWLANHKRLIVTGLTFPQDLALRLASGGHGV
ncbi:hypothetical protein ACHAW5_000702 [Stephanodiscus triporus]|uniref:Uncharacterized protein n=1 Tax=Stephanodiscus triporus TaxID=2934178 RepID=A0ABD3P2P5_9STRA